MILSFQQVPIFLRDFNFSLGSRRRSLEDLSTDGKLSGSLETLSAAGYRYNRTVGPDETLLSLARGCLDRSLRNMPEPDAVVFQHCQSESAVIPWETGEVDLASRLRYFAPVVMKAVGLDHVPYFCSFASGCAGFSFALTTAAGLVEKSPGARAICFLGDTNPVSVSVDMSKERILGSDHSSTFTVAPENGEYQLLGINFYSTARPLVPLLELVKRTIGMIRELALRSGVDLQERDVAIHYPNIFPTAWEMVTRGLRLPLIQHVLEDMPERAHCGGSDSVISLLHQHRGHDGRLHFVVNYGVGLHLVVALLAEQGTRRTENGSDDAHI